LISRFMKTPESGLSLISEVLATAGLFWRESERLFRPLGLTAAQYNVLATLAASSEALNQRTLADVLVVDRSAITGLLDRLERTGWVRREADPADRRAYRVVLTAAGRRKWDEARPVYHAAVRGALEEVTERRVQEATATLRRVQAGVAAWTEGQRNRGNAKAIEPKSKEP
jgi:DNA-binding MarR family transcriptional regulator